MDKVLEFLKECKTFYLTTIDGDQPKVRPFGTICKFENKLYIQTDKRKSVAHQIKANPKFEICVCKENYQWIRITGKLILDERLEPQKAILEEHSFLEGIYEPGDGKNEVYYMQDVKAQIINVEKIIEEITF